MLRESRQVQVNLIADTHNRAKGKPLRSATIEQRKAKTAALRDDAYIAPKGARDAFDMNRRAEGGRDLGTNIEKTFGIRARHANAGPFNYRVQITLQGGTFNTCFSEAGTEDNGARNPRRCAISNRLCNNGCRYGD